MSMSELEAQRTRADMWFRRAGELLDESSVLREQVAAATAAAATMRSEAVTARSVADDLARRCSLLSQQVAEQQGSAAAVEKECGIELVPDRAAQQRAEQARDDERHRRELLSSELEAARSGQRRIQVDLDRERRIRQRVEEELERERRERERCEAELERERRGREDCVERLEREWRERERCEEEIGQQRRRADSLRRRVGDLEAALDQVASQAQERKQLQLKTAPSPPPRPSLPATAVSLGGPGVCGSDAEPTGAAAVNALVTATDDVRVGPAGIEGYEATERAISLLVRGVLSDELKVLGEGLRATATEQAEAACNSRIAILETAVGQLVGALDAETHRLLLKWRGQLEATLRENKMLREQGRVAHIKTVDLKNALQRAQQRDEDDPAQSGREVGAAASSIRSGANETLAAVPAARPPAKERAQSWTRTRAARNSPQMLARVQCQSQGLVHPPAAPGQGLPRWDGHASPTPPTVPSGAAALPPVPVAWQPAYATAHVPVCYYPWAYPSAPQ